MDKRSKLAKRLNQSGWEIVQVPLASDCWWAKETWRLSSTRTPTGLVVYMSFLVDPTKDIDMNNIQERDIWAVGLSSHLPTDRQDAEQQAIPIKRNFDKFTPMIMLEVEKFRASV